MDSFDDQSCDSFMLAHKVEMELPLASEIDPHPVIPVNASCQHFEPVDDEKGPRLGGSPRPTAEPQHRRRRTIS